MPSINANGVELAYDLHGDPAHPTLLLIQGLSMPSTATPPAMIEQLTAAGYRVLTFDNRDAGQSQLLEHLKPANFLMQAVRQKLHMKVSAAYLLEDMMRDTSALLAGLKIDSAHVVGVSMGGMIAQALAIHHPEQVSSLTSIMSTTGRRGLPGPERQVARHIIKGPDEPTAEARLNYQRHLWRLLGSPDYPLPDAELEAFLQRVQKRGMTAQGSARQSLAILGSPSRVAGLQQLERPTLVIHGEADPLVPIAAGYDTANAVKGARMITIPGMGHDLPEALLGRICDAIVQHTGAGNPARN